MDELSRLTLRELMTMARERLGTGASQLKTKDELIAALSGSQVPAAPAPAPREEAPEIVTRDFFRRRS